jgi:hypothetical protein
MKSPKLKILLLLLVWCVSSGTAYWVGLTRNAANNKIVVTGKGKALTDHGTAIILNSVNQSVLSTKDLMQSKGRPDADALKAWADSLDPSECPGILDELQKMADGQPRDAMMDAMIASWAARDPNAYLQTYTKITDPRIRETGVGDALKALATKDPKAAIAFITDSTEAVPAQMLAQRYRDTIQGLAANDPATALSFVQGLDPNAPASAQIQRQGLTAIADALANSGNFTDALTMFATLPDAEKTTASAELMRQWAQLAPADATKYIAAMTDPTQQSTAASQVARNWARDNPAAAAAWAVQFDSTSSDSTGQPTGAALAAAMRSWSRYDLNGPAAFLNTLTPSPQTDQAVATFAAQARNVDSATALTWSNQITDAATRDKAIGSVAIRMLASGDTAGLQAAIASNQISPDQAQWLSTLPTDNPQALNRMARRMGANFTTNANRTAPWASAPATAAAATPQGNGGGQGGLGRGGRGGG